MAAVKRDIELRPHVAIDRNGKEIVFAQDQVFIKGMRAGYIGHQPGTSLCMIRPVDKDTLAAIYKKIADKFGKEPSGTLTAPVIESRDDVK